MPPQQKTVDIKSVLEKETKELATFGVTKEGICTISTRKWDPETGVELDPELYEFNLIELQRNLAFAKQRVVELETIVTKFKLLQKP